MSTVVNHVGICVSDLARSRRFYEEALGFVFQRELQPPDELTGPLLGIDPPIGLRAAYLSMGHFVLELLHYDRPGNPTTGARLLNEPGLTHLSITTDDLAGMLDRVRRFGGEVVDTSDIGLAILVRDPDGQILELLPSRQGVPT